MLAGDWNDGMDTVGIEGRGESVWLAWFFAHTARRFAKLLEESGDKHGAAALLSAASRLGRRRTAPGTGSGTCAGILTTARR